jgi:sialate O-acetylesterase
MPVSAGKPGRGRLRPNYPFTHMASLQLLLAGVLNILLPGSSMAQETAPILHGVFQDHLVLQRDAVIPIWGTARPGELVTVSVAGARATATADVRGRWSVQLPPLPAGGPHELAARTAGGAVQSVHDVLVGDVFFCSGQSNMEWPVSGALNGGLEAIGADNQRIRMLTVQRAASPAPMEVFSHDLRWEVASPEKVGNWSAVCYFFARTLQPHTDVPIGLINSSWGGSNIRAWMSAEALGRVPGHDEQLALLDRYGRDERGAQQGFGTMWEDWWRHRSNDAPGAEPWQPQTGAAWPAAPPELGDWKAWGFADLAGHFGMLWYRTIINLTPEQARQDAVLSLGAADEVDQTWLNGQVIGNTFGWGTERTYVIPATMLREGENVLVVNVLNTWGMGGLVGEADRRFLAPGNGEQIPLAAWQYRKADTTVGSPPRAPWESVAGLSTIHNAMVAPIGPYRVRGVLWYQGESNTGEPDTYQPLMESLIVQWREQFGSDAAVLLVQLANFGRPPEAPSESGWAKVREAQRLATVDDPNAGYVVTIDIGDVYDIHPVNKQEVGRRLARAARHVIYGESLFPSGPAPIGAVRLGDEVVISFAHIEGSLRTYSHHAPVGFEICDSAGVCQYAETRIDGTTVRLSIPDGLNPTRVRYAWSDSPIVNLYDGSGLPATPFELEIIES